MASFWWWDASGGTTTVIAAAAAVAAAAVCLSLNVRLGSCPGSKVFLVRPSVRSAGVASLHLIVRRRSVADRDDSSINPAAIGGPLLRLHPIENKGASFFSLSLYPYSNPDPDLKLASSP